MHAVKRIFVFYVRVFRALSPLFRLPAPSLSNLPTVLLLSLVACAHAPDPPVGGRYDGKQMPSLVEPPKNIAPHHALMLAYADWRAGKTMQPGRVLAWSPDISLGSGALEQYIEDGAAKNMSDRLRTMLRMRVSYLVPSPFALDINSWDYRRFNINQVEIDALCGRREIDSVGSFSRTEKIALRYAGAMTQTPVRLSQQQLDDMRQNFSEKEIVAIVALIAKVNYWARLLEGLRIKPAGYTRDSALHLKDYDTFSGHYGAIDSHPADPQPP